MSENHKHLFSIHGARLRSKEPLVNELLLVLKQDTPGLASVVIILARSRVKRRNQVYTRSGGVGHTAEG